MLQYLKIKLYRLKTSRNYLKIVKLFHAFFSEKFREEIAIPDYYNYEIHRIKIINEIIDLKKFENYLEIGCDQNELFEKVKIENKVGVDPNNGGTHRMTSDIFFRNNEKKFDLIFIDGLHFYNQVRKDILNSLKIINNNGFILLHDCFPFTYFDQAIPRTQKKWNGDVWKAISEFRTYDNLNVFVGAFDNGIGLIYKKKNENKLILDKNIKDFSKMKYKDYYYNYKKYLNLIDYKNFLKKINEHR